MKAFLWLALFASLVLSGCVSEREIISDIPYDDAYSRTIQFAAAKGWAVIYENKEAGVIQISLREKIVPGVIQGVGDRSAVIATPPSKKDVLHIIINRQEGKIVIKLRADSRSITWNPEETFKEYESFISGK